jgi:hypothetical protein
MSKRGRNQNKSGVGTPPKGLIKESLSKAFAKTAAGEEPEARAQKKKAENVVAADEVVAQSPATPGDANIEFDWAEDDNEGDEQFGETKKKKGNKPRAERSTEVKKLQGQTIVDPSGAWLQAQDGGKVQINIAKFVLKKLTATRIAELEKKGLKAKEGSKLTEEFYECMLFSSTSNTKHGRFVKVGENTGNLMKHCDRFHEGVLAGIERLVKETPPDEAADAITRWVSNIRPPIAPMSRFITRRPDAMLDAEVSALIWFLDAQIAFNQFDNPLFRDFVDRSGAKFGSSDTIVESLLPMVYRYVLIRLLEFLRKCASFWTTADGFSRFGVSFVSQNYHMIDPASFEFVILCLDVIPFMGQKYAEVLAGSLKERQAHWTSDFVPEPIVAGCVTDGESKFQAAAKIISEDHGRCNNHLLKSVYEDLTEQSTQFKADFNEIVIMLQYICVQGNISKRLAAYQRRHELDELAFVFFNETRWEGRFQVVTRLLALQESVGSVFEENVLSEWRESVPDFLKEGFFNRLLQYSVILGQMNQISLLFQHQSFPSGMMVPVSVLLLYDLSKSNKNMDPPFLQDFKTSLRDAVDGRMGFLLRTKNNFLKAALLFPTMAKLVIPHVNESVISLCFSSILDDAFAFAPAALDFLTLSLDYYRKTAVKLWLFAFEFLIFPVSIVLQKDWKNGTGRS